MHACMGWTGDGAARLVSGAWQCSARSHSSDAWYWCMPATLPPGLPNLVLLHALLFLHRILLRIKVHACTADCCPGPSSPATDTSTLNVFAAVLWNYKVRTLKLRGVEAHVPEGWTLITCYGATTRARCSGHRWWLNSHPDNALTLPSPQAPSGGCRCVLAAMPPCDKAVVMPLYDIYVSCHLPYVPYCRPRWTSTSRWW